MFYCYIKLKKNTKKKNNHIISKKKPRTIRYQYCSYDTIFFFLFKLGNFKVVYEETMHTLYRFNTLLITRGHVISKRKHTKVRHQYCSYETMHWFELLTLYISDRVSEREEQGWFFG